MSILKRRTIKHLPRGDTLVEVMFAVGIFGMVAIGAISLMNKGIATSQATLETTMARQEIDAQSESLRFIHNAYIAETNDMPTGYSDAWEDVTNSQHMYTAQSIVAEIPDFFTKETERGQSCADLYETRPSKSFALNARNLVLEDENLTGDVFVEGTRIQLATTYPRLLYGREQAMSDATVDESGMESTVQTEVLYAAEGIWVTGVESEAGGNDDLGNFQPDYYDYYVQTCWDAAGSGEATTLSSIIRLYNPNRIVKEGRTEFRGFALTYDAHGGSGAPPKVTVKDITTSYYDFTVSDIKPQYDEAHEFLGWSTSKTAISAEYSAGDTVRATKRNTVLYAVWSQKHRHTLSYRSTCPNTSNLPTSEYSDWTADSSHTFTISSEIPRCEGHQFRGWSTSSTATTPSYTPGNTITVVGDAVLNAVWQRTYVFYLNYDGNGSNVSNLPSTAVSQEVTTNSHRFRIDSSTPTRTNYVFEGWSRTSNGSVAFSPGDIIEVTTQETTLYAIWRRAYTIKLDYDANGGTGAPESVTYGPSSEPSHVFTVSSIVPERPNHTFLGWSVSKTATTASYRGGNSINLVSNTTLYAVWSRYYVFNLAYDANGGLGAPAMQTSGLKASPSHTFTISNTTPTYSGYEFLGWALTRNSTEPDFVGGSSLTVTNEGTTTIYAVWRPRFRFTLSYNANGGAGAPESQDSGYVASYSHTFTISSAVPTRTNYEFMGWSVSSSASTASYQPGGTITVAGNTVLFAVWRRIYTYSLIYDANGGTGAPPTQTYTGPNSSTTFTISSTRPTNGDTDFVGWSTASAAGSASYQPGDEITLSTNVKLYAVWRSPYMQDFYCLSLRRGESTTLIDNRDSNKYVVKHLNDDNCWMITNLRFAGDGDGSTNGTKTLDTFSSDVSIDRTIEFYDIENYSMCGGSNGKNRACSHRTDTDVFYNYAAATAMTATGDNYPTAVGESICPAGWTLPTKTQFQKIFTFWEQYEPWSTETVGTYYRGLYEYNDGARFWWTSTITKQERQYSAAAVYSGDYSSALTISNNSTLEDAFFIRCIKKP
ncbi:InlB B-repeat-containing protein [Candidatus Saccharibacteria bacterium]|nr:InlB B-repeat-containing protein [Candidatus Saccharibacteria bacterium]